MRLLVPILLFLLASCSVQNPLYTGKDLVELPEMVGTWKGHFDKKPNLNYTLTQGVDKTYLLTFINDKQKISTTVRFLKLGDDLFIDVESADSIKVEHIIGKIILFKKNKLEIGFLKMNYIEQLKRDGKISIISEGSGLESFNIIESTEGLQKLVVKLSNDKKAFGDIMKLKRRHL